jgi:hypothetical protein
MIFASLTILNADRTITFEDKQYKPEQNILNGSIFSEDSDSDITPPWLMAEPGASFTENSNQFDNTDSDPTEPLPVQTVVETVGISIENNQSIELIVTPESPITTEQTSFVPELFFEKPIQIEREIKTVEKVSPIVELFETKSQENLAEEETSTTLTETGIAIEEITNAKDAGQDLAVTEAVKPEDNFIQILEAESSKTPDTKPETQEKTESENEIQSVIFEESSEPVRVMSAIVIENNEPSATELSSDVTLTTKADKNEKEDFIEPERSELFQEEINLGIVIEDTTNSESLVLTSLDLKENNSIETINLPETAPVAVQTKSFEISTPPQAEQETWISIQPIVITRAELKTEQIETNAQIIPEQPAILNPETWQPEQATVSIELAEIDTPAPLSAANSEIAKPEITEAGIALEEISETTSLDEILQEEAFTIEQRVDAEPKNQIEYSPQAVEVVATGIQINQLETGKPEAQTKFVAAVKQETLSIKTEQPEKISTRPLKISRRENPVKKVDSVPVKKVAANRTTYRAKSSSQAVQKPLNTFSKAPTTMALKPVVEIAKQSSAPARPPVKIEATFQNQVQEKTVEPQARKVLANAPDRNSTSRVILELPKTTTANPQVIKFSADRPAKTNSLEPSPRPGTQRYNPIREEDLDEQTQTRLNFPQIQLAA